MKSQVESELSKVLGYRFLCCKLHGEVYRKKLVSKDEIFFVFPLIRIQVKYKKGNTIRVETGVVYPADIYPYGRKTLDVTEEIAVSRYCEGYSWKELGDIMYERYEFSLNSIKATVRRLDLVYNRLLTVGLIKTFTTVSHWLNNEERSFCFLSLAYRRRMVSGIFYSGIFAKDLFCA